MFKLALQKKVRWPVTVQIPQDGGGVTRATIRVEFALLGAERQAELMRSARLDDQDSEFLAEVVTGWEDVADEEGNPIAFSPEARRTLTDIPYVRAALLRGYFEVASGNAAARKN